MSARGTLTLSLTLTGGGGEQVTTRLEIPVAVDETSVVVATGEIARYLDEAVDRFIPPAARAIMGIGAAR